MEIPDILQGDVHLPLTEGTTSIEAIALSNSFYGTALVETDFRMTQTSVSPYGVLSLELIEDATGFVVVTFVNKNQSKSMTSALNGIVNPLLGVGGVDWLTSPVTVYNAQEITFLDSLENGETYPAVGSDNELAFRLSALLNQYNVLGRWVSGTLGDYCTGGFKLVYKGAPELAPSEFQVGGSSYVVIVQILHGTNQGYICLRV